MFIPFTEACSTDVRTVIQQRGTITGLVTVNDYLIREIIILRGRVTDVENANTRFNTTVPSRTEQRLIEYCSAANRRGPLYRPETDDRSRSPSPSPPEYRQRGQRAKHEKPKTTNAAAASSKAKNSRVRKDLQVTVPEQPMGLSAVGLPTPTSAVCMSQVLAE